MNLHRVLNLASKEWRELLRDRMFFALAFLLPFMMMLLFGYAYSQDTEHVPFTILDYDRTQLSREFSQHFIGSRYFQFMGYANTDRDVDRLIRSGTARFAIVIPDKFEQRVYAGLPGGIQTLFDGTFIVSVRTIRGYVDSVASAAGAEITAEYVSAHAGIPLSRAQAMMLPVSLETRYLYNQPLRTIWGTAPLLIMMILMWAAPLLMAVSVVREKESGAIYNIYASTISRAEFLLGKLTPIVAVTLLNTFVLWAMAVWFYGAPFRGSLSCFAVGSFFYVISICELGMLLSVALKTQLAALLISVIVGSMVASQYSGINVPVADLKGAEYAIAHLFPAMYFTEVLEAVFLRGQGWPEVGGEVAILAGYSLITFVIGCMLFHKRVAA